MKLGDSMTNAKNFGFGLLKKENKYNLIKERKQYGWEAVICLLFYYTINFL